MLLVLATGQAHPSTSGPTQSARVSRAAAAARTTGRRQQPQLPSRQQQQLQQREEVGQYLQLHLLLLLLLLLVLLLTVLLVAHATCQCPALSCQAWMLPQLQQQQQQRHQLLHAAAASAKTTAVEQQQQQQQWCLRGSCAHAGQQQVWQPRHWRCRLPSATAAARTVAGVAVSTRMGTCVWRWSCQSGRCCSDSSARLLLRPRSQRSQQLSSSSHSHSRGNSRGSR